MATSTWTTAPASISQRNTVAKLRVLKAIDAQAAALLADWDNVEGHEVPSKGLASAILDNLFHADWAPRTPVAAPVTEAGMYRNAEGQVYRVKAARGSGRLYASELVITPEDGGNFSAQFDYAAGAIYRLTAADRMTGEQAREIGHEFAICCVCAAVLTHPTSVAEGIGPVCGGRV